MKTPALTGEFSTRLQTVCAACILCICDIHAIILTYQYLNIYRQRLWVLFARVFASVRCTVRTCRSLWQNIKKTNKSCCTNRVTPRTFPAAISEDYKVIVSLLTRAPLVTPLVYIIG